MLKRTMICLIAAALVIAPAGAATAATPDRQVLREKLEAVHTAGMPGAFAEVRDGHRTWTPTAGVADITTGAPIRDGMRHRIGSITKTFVATTVLQLAGEHRVTLDAPIGRYVPGLVPADLGRAVTVRMLLNHTSGIGGRFWGHDGGTIGHRTISWHSADGRTQLTYARNMAFYAVPAIDTALADFIVTALCGDQSATWTAVATPDLRRLLVSR
jgi:CubicO group peptidase (beta-lactamase class C family)